MKGDIVRHVHAVGDRSARFVGTVSAIGKLRISLVDVRRLGHDELTFARMHMDVAKFMIALPKLAVGDVVFFRAEVVTTRLKGVVRIVLVAPYDIRDRKW